MQHFMQNMSNFCRQYFPDFKKGKKYKIGFTGTHGTGKTTAINIAHAWVKLYYPKLNTRLLSELARESFMPINEKATFESQLWLMSKHIEQEIFLMSKYDILLCDRTVYDYIAYMFSLCGEKSELLRAYEEYMHSYTQIYYFPIEKGWVIEDDGVRSIDPVWRSDIDAIIYGNLKRTNLDNIIFLDKTPLAGFCYETK